MEDLVSIIMPAHNSGKYISDSIQSVLNQTYPNWELIISLDNCTDNTESICLEFAKKDNRIKILKTQNNKTGAIGARNLAIKSANGRFVAFLDADDLWKKNKLEIQLNFMNNMHADFTYGNYDVLHKNGSITTFVAKPFATYKMILKTCHIGCLTVIYDTKKLGKIYMPESAFKREDFATWLHILKMIPRGYNVNENIGIYRIVDNSVSRNKTKLIKYHWNVLRNIEKINFFKSIYYLLSTIFFKLFKY